MSRRSRHKKSKQKVHKQPKPKMETGLLPWWILLILAAVAFATYAHTISYEFVYDDDFQVLRNPWIRDWSNLGKIFTTDVWRFRDEAKSSNYYRPVHMILHMLGHSLSGLNPQGYHLINLLLHSLCTILVALISYKLFDNIMLSVASGLIFALHPIHSESVAWIAGVTDLACAVFYFGALYFCIWDGESSERRPYLPLIIFCYFGALLSKEMAFTFPIMAFLLDMSLRRKMRWSRYLSWVAISAVYLLLRFAALGRFQAHESQVNLDLYTRALSIIQLLGSYILKLFIPHDMNAFHIFTPTTSILSGRFVISVVVLAVYGILAWIMRKRPGSLFVFAFAPVSLLPVLHLEGIGENVFADRYLYIPSLGVSLLIPLLTVYIREKLPVRLSVRALPIAGAMLALLLCCYAYILSKTTYMWRDNFTLYSETLKRSPTACYMANSLGSVYFARGDYEKAKQYFSSALEAWKKNFFQSDLNLFVSYSGLGGVSLHQGEHDVAIAHFTKAHDIKPDEVVGLNNLGVAYATIGEHGRAIDYYLKALSLNPNEEATYNNLAALYVKTKNYDEAILQAEKALEIYPAWADAFINLARAYAGKNMHDLARHAYQEAKRVDPSKAALVNSELERLSAP